MQLAIDAVLVDDEQPLVQMGEQLGIVQVHAKVSAVVKIRERQVGVHNVRVAGVFQQLLGGELGRNQQIGLSLMHGGRALLQVGEIHILDIPVLRAGVFVGAGFPQGRQPPSGQIGAGPDRGGIAAQQESALHMHGRRRATHEFKPGGRRHDIAENINPALLEAVQQCIPLQHLEFDRQPLRCGHGPQQFNRKSGRLARLIGEGVGCGMGFHAHPQHPRSRGALGHQRQTGREQQDGEE